MANETEREQWGGGIGRVWVERQADLDLLMATATGLLIDRAGIGRGERVLDVGCGAGDSTLAAARAVGAGGAVTGMDLAAQLLAVARARVRAEGLGHVTLIEGDAQTDPAPGRPFDRVISRFGVMFFADPVAAFANLAAQMRPGGTVTLVAWGPAEANPWFIMPARIAAGRLGAPPPTPPGAPGPLAFADAAHVTGILSRAGLGDVRAEAADVDLRHPRADDLATLATEVGPAARILRLHGAGAEDRAAMREAILAGLAPFREGEGARIPARLMVYRATS